MQDCSESYVLINFHEILGKFMPIEQKNGYILDVFEVQKQEYTAL